MTQGGDWDKRGKDVETLLAGPITDTLIDAARLARFDHQNGFPNWAMFRLIYSGERCHMAAVREWWVLFSIEWCRNHMREDFDIDLAVNAAWDSLARVMEPKKSSHPSRTEVAKALEVRKDRFIFASVNLQAVLDAALSVYSEWLEIGYRVAKAKERRI